MSFGQLVIGPAGCGKTTYCNGMQHYLRLIGREVSVINLDPANDKLPYDCDVDISDLVTLESVMIEFGLGPNDGEGAVFVPSGSQTRASTSARHSKLASLCRGQPDVQGCCTAWSTWSRTLTGCRPSWSLCRQVHHSGSELVLDNVLQLLPVRLLYLEPRLIALLQLGDISYSIAPAKWSSSPYMTAPRQCWMS